MHINQTSSEQYGQIYVPFVNWVMMLGTLALTVIFAQSDRLAGAYGAAVSTTMLDDHCDPVSHHAGVVAVAGVGCGRRVCCL